MARTLQSSDYELPRTVESPSSAVHASHGCAQTVRSVVERAAAQEVRR